MASSTKKGEELINKYFDSDSFILFSRPTDDRDYKILLARREKDYVLVTSKGEEFPIPYETLDKVRDVMSGNMTGLTEYEDKFFKRFNYEHLLKDMAKESMMRYFEKEGADRGIIGMATLLGDIMFNPGFCMPLREEYSGEELKVINKRKEAISTYLKEEFGYEGPVDNSTITNLLIKMSSDKDVERKRFMKDALKKKKD